MLYTGFKQTYNLALKLWRAKTFGNNYPTERVSFGNSVLVILVISGYFNFIYNNDCWDWKKNTFSTFLYSIWVSICIFVIQKEKKSMLNALFVFRYKYNYSKCLKGRNQKYFLSIKCKLKCSVGKFSNTVLHFYDKCCH